MDQRLTLPLSLSHHNNTTINNMIGSNDGIPSSLAGAAAVAAVAIPPLSSSPSSLSSSSLPSLLPAFGAINHLADIAAVISPAHQPN